MFKDRNLINAIGIPAWIFLIIKGGIFYSIIILICMVIALGEFYNLQEKKGAQPLRWMGMASSVFIADYYYMQPSVTSHELLGAIILVIMLSCIWELFAAKKNPGQNISITLAGILYVSVLLGTAIDIRQFDHLMDTQLTLALMLSVWVCDSTAFILGTLYGKKKIFPSVSPNKSWFGSISGLLASVVVMTIFSKQGWLGDYFTFNDSIIFGLIAGIFGQLGDFTESLLKRDAGVKNSGSLLAGHGGVLDRFDSLIFAMPLSYLYIHIFMHI